MQSIYLFPHLMCSKRNYFFLALYSVYMYIFISDNTTNHCIKTEILIM